ncbi:MAG: hypothetical protein FWF26_04810 [Treponema sp.]|nr:hypothetical protein [Treponema sp.]
MNNKTVRFLTFFLVFIVVPGIFTPIFALDPITANPRAILNYPVDSWRDKRYEVFRWDAFPEILIFDTADYAVQDNLFKRLAFFVEKAGYRGRLAKDSEIADLHGWNAHDYRSADLASFFELARKTNFPLLQEERELESLLLNTGIIVKDPSGQIAPGNGAIISISRESDKTDKGLRPRFMTHEGFHGIFFVDEDFRNFASQRWEIFPAPAKKFLLSFFDFQAYDTKNQYLVVNEFMAYVLQQPVAQASWYFGEYQPSRMIAASPWRKSSLPEKEEISSDGKPFWPELAEAFTAEGDAFSRYVNQRWALAAGRVWR